MGLPGLRLRARGAAGRRGHVPFTSEHLFMSSWSAVGRVWPWERAVALDDSGDIVLEVSQALNELMEALGERTRF